MFVFHPNLQCDTKPLATRTRPHVIHLLKKTRTYSTMFHCLHSAAFCPIPCNIYPATSDTDSQKKAYKSFKFSILSSSIVIDDLSQSCPLRVLIPRELSSFAIFK